jgi:hypothetical protein
VHDGRRSLPPIAGTRAAIRAGNHGVGGPRARGGNGPPRVRGVAGGSHTPWRSVSVSVSVNRAAPVHKGGDLCRGCVAQIGATLSGRSGPVRAGDPDHQHALVPRAMTRLIRRCAELTIVARFWGTHQSNELDVVGCADHHGVDARSVLGTVQGSSLRSARASARPAGLDGACAQIMSWPLRDGRGVMTLSWTDLDR